MKQSNHGQHVAESRRNRVVAGLLSAFFIGLLVFSVSTGVIRARRSASYSEANDPFLYWALAALYLVAAGYFLLVALGILKAVTKPVKPEAARRAREPGTVALLVFGIGVGLYEWISQRMAGATGFGVDGLAYGCLLLVGLLSWTPLVPEGRLRSGIRFTGTALAMWGALMIYLGINA